MKATVSPDSPRLQPPHGELYVKSKRELEALEELPMPTAADRRRRGKLEHYVRAMEGLEDWADADFQAADTRGAEPAADPARLTAECAELRREIADVERLERQGVTMLEVYVPRRTARELQEQLDGDVDALEEEDGDPFGADRPSYRPQLHGQAKEMAEQLDQDEEALAAALRPLPPVAVPENRQERDHAAGHLVVAAVRGLPIAVGTALYEALAPGIHNPHSLALFALAGEAMDRLNAPLVDAKLSARSLFDRPNLIAAPVLGLSAEDLEIATLALGPHATADDWREARRQAFALVQEWSRGIEAVGLVLMRTGRMTGDDVLRTLRATYRGEPWYLEQLAPPKRQPWQ
jgi:hypothetical protein